MALRISLICLQKWSIPWLQNKMCNGTGANLQCVQPPLLLVASRKRCGNVRPRGTSFPPKSDQHSFSDKVLNLIENYLCHPTHNIYLQGRGQSTDFRQTSFSRRIQEGSSEKATMATHQVNNMNRKVWIWNFHVQVLRSWFTPLASGW